jgi:hypothetical protein
MKPKTDQPTGNLGMTANGSSRRWYVAVDETLDVAEWSLEIDGPQAYLVFQLRGPQVVLEAARFLRSGPASHRKDGRRGETGELLLGRFGSASVSLVWDDEGSGRCFLVVGPKARSTLRLTLEADDVRRIREALVQVLEDMPRVRGT